MKLLYTLIILFAFSFAQSGRLFLSADNAMNINFDKICDGYIEYSIKKNGIISFKSIEIDKVCALYLDDGTEIISTAECFIDNSTESIVPKGKKGRIGRLFIKGGAILIYVPLSVQFEADKDSWISLMSGIVLISIGGILVTLGI